MEEINLLNMGIAAYSQTENHSVAPKLTEIGRKKFKQSLTDTSFLTFAQLASLCWRWESDCWFWEKLLNLSDSPLRVTED